MSRQPIVLTERGEWVRDIACAVLALIVIPCCFWALCKVVGL